MQVGWLPALTDLLTTPVGQHETRGTQETDYRAQPWSAGCAGRRRGPERRMSYYS
jgi:hypothetical protein